MQTPVMVMNTNSKRESGRKAQLANIQAAKVIPILCNVARHSFSFLSFKHILGCLINRNFDSWSTSHVENASWSDGRYCHDQRWVRIFLIFSNAILREIDVQHPAAKSVIELARVQDEEVGDGTTSVIITTGELMLAAKPFMEMNIHPTVVVSAYYKALDFAKKVIADISKPIDTSNDE